VVATERHLFEAARRLRDEELNLDEDMISGWVVGDATRCMYILTRRPNV
jgi:hypothetical protein